MAREERLKVSGNPSQYDDLQPFIDEQDTMRRLVSESILPALEVDISDGNVSKAAARIADWLEETGGLWANSRDEIEKTGRFPGHFDQFWVESVAINCAPLEDG